MVERDYTKAGLAIVASALIVLIALAIGQPVRTMCMDCEPWMNLQSLAPNSVLGTSVAPPTINIWPNPADYTPGLSPLP